LTPKVPEVIENISEVNRFQNHFDHGKSLIKSRLGFEPRFAVLYAGTFGRVNGIDYVIRLAAHTMRIDPGIVYILVGNGSEREKVIKMAEDSGLLKKNVFFLDVVAKNELPQLYYEVDMGSSFVIDVQELWANSANKFFDTLAAGRPVLINHGGWQSRIIHEFNVGYVLPPVVNEDIAQEFVKYTTNVELQRLQRKNSIAKATESYALEVAVNKYLGIFKN